MADDGNLSAEQTDTLIQFQEITHIESIDECKQILEAFQWNFEVAVQNTFNDTNENINNRANATTNAQTPSTSSSPHTSISNNLNSNNDGIFYRENSLSTSSSSSSLNQPSAPTPTPPPQAPPNPPNLYASSNNRSFTTGSNSNLQNQLPNVNINTQRSLSYSAPRQQAVVPRGFFEWSVFLFSFPFRFLFSTLVDLASFFWSFFESSSVPTDYDPLANIAEYAIYYNQKYGTNHPDFYQGSYSQAVNEAKRDLKFLLVYIHQNDHRDCNTIATQTLTNPDLVEFINNTFLFWSCSKNLPEGRKVFNGLKAKRCPFLGVIVLKNSRMTLVSKIEGPISTDELILQLHNVIAENEADLVATRVDRETLSANQLIRQQQDQAFLESLKVDQEKAKKKKEAEEAAKAALELEKRREEEEKEREAAVLRRKADLRKLLAETPQPEATNPLTLKLIIKLPSGNRFERFFLKTDPLSDLYKFVFSNEECPINFEIVTNFPRKVIECTEDTATSIQEFGINQSMILFVNDLDA